MVMLFRHIYHAQLLTSHSQVVRDSIKIQLTECWDLQTTCEHLNSFYVGVKKPQGRQDFISILSDPKFWSENNKISAVYISIFAFPDYIDPHDVLLFDSMWWLLIGQCHTARPLIGQISAADWQPVIGVRSIMIAKHDGASQHLPLVTSAALFSLVNIILSRPLIGWAMEMSASEDQMETEVFYLR